MKHFKSSILRFGPIFTPYNVYIDKKSLTFRRNNGIGFLYLSTNEVTFKIMSITDIVILDEILWCNIKIINISGSSILLKHFTREDAMKIKELII
jgi:hypothetical protein